MKYGKLARGTAIMLAFVITAFAAVGCGNGDPPADTGDPATVDAAAAPDGTTASPAATDGEPDKADKTDAANTDAATELSDVTAEDTETEPETTSEPETTAEPETTKTPETAKAPDPAGHTHSYKTSAAVKPTCTERGYTTYTCSGCGDTYTEYMNATGHKWHDYTYDQENGPEIRALMSGSIPPGEEYDRLFAYWQSIVPGVRCEYCDICRCEVEGHHGNPPTCTVKSICQYCLKVTVSEALGHDFVHGICSRCTTFDFASEELITALTDRVIYYLNKFREEEGTHALEKTPGLTELSQYRAVQLTTNYAHDPDDITEAYFNTQHGYDYYGSPEAIAGCTSSSGEIDSVAYIISNGLRNSEGHWDFLRKSYYNYIGVGVYCGSGYPSVCFCVTVSPNNYG